MGGRPSTQHARHPDGSVWPVTFRSIWCCRKSLRSRELFYHLTVIFCFLLVTLQFGPYFGYPLRHSFPFRFPLTPPMMILVSLESGWSPFQAHKRPGVFGLAGHLPEHPASPVSEEQDMVVTFGWVSFWILFITPHISFFLPFFRFFITATFTLSSSSHDDTPVPLVKNLVSLHNSTQVSPRVRVVLMTRA